MHSAFKKVLLVSTMSLFGVVGGPVTMALADTGAASSFEAGPNGGFDTSSPATVGEGGTGGGQDTGTGGGQDTGTGGGQDTGTGGGEGGGTGG
ncbi:hypothetical protein GHK48_03425, partial [Sinorhizobium fredii]|nr:hypothetical protein [Sinorhizobium fredii]